MPSDQLIREYADLSRRTTEAMEGLKEAMYKLNDTLVLHQEIEKTSAETISNITSFWKLLTLILLLSIVTLAGAEKIIPLFTGKI